MNKTTALCAILLVILALPATAIVDMRNANYSDTWHDIVVPGTGYDLRVQRIYNSRTIYSGIFGFGWCSDFETKLEITAEGNLKVTHCGAGAETDFVAKGFHAGATEKTINTIMAEVKKRNPKRTKRYFENLKSELSKNTFLREEFARQLKLEGEIQQGKAYLAQGREADSIELKGDIYIRSIPDGTFQRFNKNGQLIAMYDKNGNHIKIRYKKDRIDSVIDDNGRQLNFKYSSKSNKVYKILGPNGLTATYEYKGDDLVSVNNAWKNVFAYAYDDLHNLTLIKYPDKTTKKLTYNTTKDWVTSFTNRRGCKETYSYESEKARPLDHYWSTVKKVCGKKVTNESRYEFWHKKNSKGERFLHRVVTIVNGKKNDVIYHEIFGRPVSVLSGGQRTNFEYYDNGLVKLKSDKYKKSLFSYKNKCQKVSKVLTTFKAPGGSGNRKLAGSNKQSTMFYYDAPKCNLIAAKSSTGQKIQIKYDHKGRIAQIKDQSKKSVKITYNESNGKPEKIDRPGLGSIRVSYKADGSVAKTSSKQGPRVAKQVASIFNNLLEVIAPATAEVNL